MNTYIDIYIYIYVYLHIFTYIWVLWLVLWKPFFIKIPGFLVYFLDVLLAGVGGWCFHVSGILLGTSCAPHMAPITLGVPICWGMFPWLFFMALLSSQHKFFCMFCVLLAGVGVVFPYAWNQFKVFPYMCSCILIYSVVSPCVPYIFFYFPIFLCVEVRDLFC